jgi:hypothetical protein
MYLDEIVLAKLAYKKTKIPNLSFLQLASEHHIGHFTTN